MTQDTKAVERALWALDYIQNDWQPKDGEVVFQEQCEVLRKYLEAFTKRNLIPQWQPIDDTSREFVGKYRAASYEQNHRELERKMRNFFREEHGTNQMLFGAGLNYLIAAGILPTPPEEDKASFTASELKEGDYVTFCKTMGLRDGVVTKDENGYMAIKPEEREQTKGNENV